MGFFDRVRQEREAAKSRREYAECYKARQEKLRSFRNNAILEILFQYPDARLLLNCLDRKFMVLLRSSGGLLHGSFADDYYPRLDYVGDTATTSERCAAVARFRYEVGRCDGNFSQDALRRRFRHSMWTYNHQVQSLRLKGFDIRGSIKLEELIGGALFMNGSQIAKASIWNPQSKGYFSTKILTEVLEGGDRRAGVQSLRFVTADQQSYGNNGEKMSYEILFDRSLHYFDENNRKAFTGEILNLRDFLYDIEDYFRPDCVKVDEDRIKWIKLTRRAEDLLDSPDRDDGRGASDTVDREPFKFDSQSLTSRWILSAPWQ